MLSVTRTENWSATQDAQRMLPHRRCLSLLPDGSSSGLRFEEKMTGQLIAVFQRGEGARMRQDIVFTSDQNTYVSPGLKRRQLSNSTGRADKGTR